MISVMPNLHLAGGVEVELSSKEDDEHRHHNHMECLHRIEKLLEPGMPVHRRLVVDFQFATTDAAFKMYGPNTFGGPRPGHVWLVQTVVINTVGAGSNFGGFGGALIYAVGLYITPTTPSDGILLAWGQTPNGTSGSQGPIFYSFSREDLLVRPSERVWGGWASAAIPTSSDTMKIEINVLEMPDKFGPI